MRFVIRKKKRRLKVTQKDVDLARAQGYQQAKAEADQRVMIDPTTGQMKPTFSEQFRRAELQCQIKIDRIQTSILPERMKTRAIAQAEEVFRQKISALNESE
jgi:hypothetical protein